MSQSGAGPYFFVLCQLRKLFFLLYKVSVCGVALSCLVQAASAAEIDVQFPKTIAWSAYPTGTGGYSQAVAIGNILQRQYKVNLRVIPGRNDVSRLATLRAGRVHFSAGGSESVYAQ